MRIILTAFVLGLMFSGAQTQTLPWLDRFDDELQPGWFWVNEDPNLHWFDNKALYFKIGRNSNGFKNRLLRSAPAGLYSIICYGEWVGEYNGQRIRILLYTDDENYASLEWNPYWGGSGDFHVVDHGRGKFWSVPDSYPNDVGLFALGYVPELGSIHVLMGTTYIYPNYEAPLDSVFQISFVPQYVAFEAVGSSGDTIIVGEGYNGGFQINEFPYTSPPKITNFFEVGGDLRVDWQTNYPIPTLPSGWEFEARLESPGKPPIVSPRLPGNATSYTFAKPDCDNGCVTYKAYVEHIPPRIYGTGPWRIFPPNSTPTVSIICEGTALLADFLPHQDPPGSPVAQFEDLSSGNPDSWLWNFGDGTTSTDQNPTHFFPAGCLQDYSVSLTVKLGKGCSDTKVMKVGITPTKEFPKPKALLVSGWSVRFVGTPFQMDRNWEFDPILLSASIGLKYFGGWDVVILRDPTYEELSTHLSSPQYRGLYVVAHGQEVNGVSKISLRRADLGDVPGAFTAEQIGNITGGREMDFVTVIACDQFRNQWEEAFNVPASEVTMPSVTIWGQAILGIEDLAARVLHGVSTRACMADHELIANRPASAFGKMSTDDPDTTCPSFLSYHDGKCGADLFPVRVCQSDIGAPYEGSIMIEAPDGTFTVRAVFPSAY